MNNDFIHHLSHHLFTNNERFYSTGIICASLRSMLVLSKCFCVA